MQTYPELANTHKFYEMTRLEQMQHHMEKFKFIWSNK